MNPKSINAFSQPDFIGDRKVNALTLAPIAQSCIVYFDFRFHIIRKGGKDYLRYLKRVAKSKPEARK